MVDNQPLVPLNAAPDLPLTASPSPDRAVTWRSGLLGSILSALICVFVPYNDYVVENTVLVGSYLPLAVVLAFFLLVVVINAPLHKYAPRHALTRGELAVIMAMMLAACGLAAQGMMRAVIPSMLSPFDLGATGDVRFFNNFLKLNLPEWLFPVESIADGRNSLVYKHFYNRLPTGEPVPFAAWIVPVAGWGVFFFSLIATLIAMAVIVAPQWAQNERLTFPIAQMQQALIEPPERGQALNSLFRSRAFWIALAAVFVIHLVNGLYRYYPKYWPEIPLGYNFDQIFSESPWVHFSWQIKTATVFFTFVGVTFFIPARMSFSLWSIFLLSDSVNVFVRTRQDEIPQAAWDDQALGASIVFVIGVLWIGRGHWAKVIRQFIGRSKEKDFPNFRPAVAALLIGPAVMIGWLMAVGAQAWAAVIIVGVVLMTHFIITRVVAETGLPCVRMYTYPMQIFSNFTPASLAGHDVYWAGYFNTNGPYQTRESLMTFVLHGLRLSGKDESARPPRGLLPLIVWAVVFCFFISVGSWLWTYYHHTMPLNGSSDLINPLALREWPRNQVADPLNQWADGRFAAKSHDPLTHVGIGAGLAGVLQFATLRWSSWPFLPVGYLLCSNPYIRSAWFSVLIGWLAKTLIVRFGGARMFQQARPLFIGLVFGESLAAAFWMIVNLWLAQSGFDYKVMQLLPR